MARYAAACRSELEAAVAAGMPEASSVFFGGGTPSLLPAELLVGILDAIPVAAGAEITVECNPDTVTDGLLRSYRAAGVNRLSFGVQSMVAHVLAGLGRTHEPDAVLTAVAAARGAGFANWSVDLIFGAAGETDDDWRRTLDQVLALDPPHVSAYALTIEAGTPLAGDPARHPDEDIQAGRYLLAEQLLVGAGLANYEISNWARPGHECRHNLLYWAQGDYRGVGCAAHSHAAGRRWWNVRTPERYIDLIEGGRTAEVVAGSEQLDRAAQAAEAAQLALRTSAGLTRSAVGGPANRQLDELVDLGLVCQRGDRIFLTPGGRLMANEVTVRLGLVGERSP